MESDAKLEKEDLLSRVVKAIRLSGWYVLVRDDTHPFRLVAYRGREQEPLRIYIWNVTSGGPASVRPSDEYRVQITTLPPNPQSGRVELLLDDEYKTLLLGWNEARGVFVAFDAKRHQSFSLRSPSVQVKAGALDGAARDGFGFSRKSNREIVVAFAPEHFMDYVQRSESLHALGNGSAFEGLVRGASGADIPADLLASLPAPRREIVTTVQRLSRDRRFRMAVLEAYERHCVACDIQLDLVTAAHIVPVKASGTDEVTNGLALCHLHHAAYDTGLVVIDPTYAIRLNRSRLEELAGTGLGGGAGAFVAALKPSIRLPIDGRYYPNPDYLRRGMELRGWPPS